MAKNITIIGKNNFGMTLVELLVAGFIMTLLMGMISVVLVRTFYVNRYVLEQGLNNTELQRAIRDFSLTLREARQSDSGAYPLEEADSFELTFYANIDDDPQVERVHYFLEAAALKRGVSEAAGFPKTYPTEDESVMTVANGIINTSGEPIFEYYNSNYPQDTANNPLLTPIAIENVSLIKLDLRANIDPNHVPDSMRMETFVKPRNIN